MPIRLFNTFTKEKEIFSPLKSGEVKMYTCGPTVYGRPHIGNYASFLMADLLVRWLTIRGYKVLQVKNITDVGHLVADRDEGEDKVEKEARRIAFQRRGEGAEITKDDVIGVARMYEGQYLEDEKALAFLEPFARPRASETIPEMISIIEGLVKKGHAYETEDGVYYDVRSFPAYGKLSGNTLDKLRGLQEGVRVDLAETKKRPADFALWKKCVGANEKHVLQWDSPWGKGFPGWHIECSAMSTKFLGEQCDIHTGGEDNIFPHHECEIAQSEGLTGKKAVGTWIHKRRVNFGNEKMSKSLGNVLSLSDLQEKGFDPLDLRFLFLSTHYRNHTAFSFKALEDARKERLKILEWMCDVRASCEREGVTLRVAEDIDLWVKEDPKCLGRLVEAMDDDLNMPEARAEIFGTMNSFRTNSFERNELPHFLRFIHILDRVFACFSPEDVRIPLEIQSLVSLREQARAKKDFQTSDALREEIRQKGFILEDKGGSVKVVPIQRRG